MTSCVPASAARSSPRRKEKLFLDDSKLLVFVPSTFPATPAAPAFHHALSSDDHESPLSRNSPISVLKGLSSNAYASYMNWLEEKPLSANSITAGAISALGDILAQWIEARVSGSAGYKLNFIRLAAFAISGMIFVGPYLHAFYSGLWALGGQLERRYNASKGLKILLQVIIDQTVGVIVFFPLYYYVYEYAEAMVALRNLGPVAARATSKIQSEIISVLMTNWAVWIPAQIITFSFIPEHLRVIVVNVVSVFWNAYLCTRVA